MTGQDNRLSSATWGAAAGLIAGLPIGVLMQWQGMVDDLGGVARVLGYGTITGAGIGIMITQRSRGLAAAASGGALLGLLGWVLFSLTVDPLLRGTVPTWSVDAAATGYRFLVGGVLQGSIAGAALYGIRSRRPPARTGSADPPPARVVIVGGGFGGVAAARRLERLALRRVPVDVTVISDSNFLLFTPMLAEVASSALEPAHISAPVRAAVAHTRFRHGAVRDVDTDARLVRVDDDWVPYDHLVLAVGSVPHVPDLPGVEDHALTMKDLGDAIRLRERVLGLLETADHVGPDPQERGRLLTFVVAGGGFAGAETIAELFDLVHGVLHLYPGIRPDEPRFVLVHSRDRILPELSAALGSYAQARLEARGIEFRLGVRVVAASASDVELDDGSRIPVATFVWTAGNRAGPLLDRVGGRHARGGGLVTDPTFRAIGLDRVWAIGDCASIPDVDSAGAPFPPTAQHALRQGTVVADNIAAVLAGREPAAFRFRTIGVLVALGHRTAAAEILGRRFSGLAAWLLWRGIYLAKLPGADKRARVLLDWLLDLVFPRDIVVTTDRREPGRHALDRTSR